MALDTSYWTVFNHITIWGSLVFYFILTFFYNFVVAGKHPGTLATAMREPVSVKKMFQFLKLLPFFLDFLVHSIVDNRGAHCPRGCVAVLYSEKKNHTRLTTISFRFCSQVDVNPTLTDRARLVQRSARVRQKEAQPR